MELKIPDVQPKDKEKFSIKQLKANLKENLKKSGVLDTVRAQIRQEFINSLALRDDTAVSIGIPKDVDISSRVIYSCIYHLLKNRKLVNSISVFVAECGLDPKYSILSEGDIIKMVRFNPICTSYKYIQDGQYAQEFDPVVQGLVSENRTSILDLLAHFCLSMPDTTVEMATQTDSSGPGVKEYLDSQVHALRQKYTLNKENEMLTPSKSIEERMVKFQRECEQRCQRDVEIQVNYIRENELNRIKLEEAQKHRMEIEAMRKQLDFEYNRRLQAHIDRENESARRLSEQEHTMQRSLYDARQLMQREIDELRSREAVNARKTDLEAQGLRMLELRLKEAQSVIDGRERDVASREKKLEAVQENARESARAEALQQVQSELQVLSRERSSLLLEKKRFEDDRGAQRALVESAQEVRQKLKASNDQLLQKQDELEQLQRIHARALQLHAEEEKRITEMVAQIDPVYGTYSRSEQIIAMIRRNADLEVKLASYRDASKLEERLNQREKEYSKLEQEHKDLKAISEADRNSCAHEIDQLKRSVAAEKARVASHTHKLEEMSQLVNDKSRTIDSLRRQFETQRVSGGSRRSNTATSSTAAPSSAGGSGAVASATSRAVDILSRSDATRNRYNAPAAMAFDSTPGGGADPAAASSGVAGTASGGLNLELFSDALIRKMLQKMSANPAVFTGGIAAGAAAPAAMTAPTMSAFVSAADAKLVQDTSLATAAAEKATKDAEAQRVAAELTALKQAAIDRERTHAAELAAALQREQLKAAELRTQMDQQQLESARIALQVEKERLQLEALEREKKLQEAQAAVASQQRAEQYALIAQQQKLAEEQAAAAAAAKMSADVAEQKSLRDMSLAAEVAQQRESLERLHEAQQADRADLKFKSAADEAARAEEERAIAVAAESMRLQHDRDHAAASASQRETIERKAAEALAVAEAARKRRDDELAAAEAASRRRVEEEAKKAAELEAEAAEAKKAAELEAEAAEAKNAAELEAEAAEAKKAAELEAEAAEAKKAAELEAEAAEAKKAAELEAEAAEAKKAAELEAEAAEAKKAAELEAEAPEAKKAAELEAEAAEAKKAAELEAEAEAKKAAELEAEAVEAKKAAELEAENERKRKEDEDAAAIQAARAKVLERRRQRQQRDSGTGASMASFNSVSSSGGVGIGAAPNIPPVASSLTSLPSQADSLDGAAPSSGGVSPRMDYFPSRNAPARNLGSSVGASSGSNKISPAFNLLNSDSDSDQKIEVGDQSEGSDDAPSW